MKFAQNFLQLFGRIAIAALFILAGVWKIFNYSQSIQYMTDKGMTMVHLFYIGAIVFEILFGTLLFLGYKTRISAIACALFLIPASLIFHNFWAVEGNTAVQLQFFIFTRNIAIMGGLFYVIAFGAGSISLDRFLCREHNDSHIH